MLSDVLDVDIEGAFIESVAIQVQPPALVIVFATDCEALTFTFAEGVVVKCPSTYQQFVRLPMHDMARRISWWDAPTPNHTLFALETGDVLIIRSCDIEVTRSR